MLTRKSNLSDNNRKRVIKMAKPRIHAGATREEQGFIKFRVLTNTRDSFKEKMKDEGISQQAFFELLAEKVGAGEVAVAEILEVLKK